MQAINENETPYDAKHPPKANLGQQSLSYFYVSNPLRALQVQVLMFLERSKSYNYNLLNIQLIN